MEFDTNIKLRPFSEITVESPLEPEAFCAAVWDAFSAHAKHIGQMGGSQFWLDYSNSLKVKYIVCDITEASAAGGVHTYKIKFSEARKPAYLSDAVLALSALAVLWGISKSVTPNPESIHIMAIGIGLAVAGAVISIIAKPFGKAFVPGLKDAVESLKSK